MSSPSLSLAVSHIAELTRSSPAQTAQPPPRLTLFLMVAVTVPIASDIVRCVFPSLIERTSRHI